MREPTIKEIDAAIALILKRDGDRDGDCGSNLTVEETLAIVEVLKNSYSIGHKQGFIEGYAK